MLNYKFNPNCISHAEHRSLHKPDSFFYVNWRFICFCCSVKNWGLKKSVTLFKLWVRRGDQTLRCFLQTCWRLYGCRWSCIDSTWIVFLFYFIFYILLLVLKTECFFFFLRSLISVWLKLSDLLGLPYKTVRLQAALVSLLLLLYFAYRSLRFQ